VHLPELAVIPREQRRLRRRDGVGAIAQGEWGKAEAKRRGIGLGELFEDRSRRGAMWASEIRELHQSDLGLPFSGAHIFVNLQSEPRFTKGRIVF
jgi:hypothetical protein